MRGPSERWVHGRHVVEETLGSDRFEVFEVLLLRERKAELGETAALAQRAGARVRWVDRRELDRLCGGGHHQGLAARIREVPRKVQTLAEFVGGLTPEAKSRALIVALDQIQDPHNFGAIARSAACLGAGALIYPERRNAPITQVVLQASAGALQRLQTFEVVNLAQALRSLKDAGFWVYGADRDGRTAWEACLNRPMVLVIGSEGEGMRPLVRSCCDEVVSIPQSEGGVESLNASCAASVLLYEALRQMPGGRK